MQLSLGVPESLEPVEANPLDYDFDKQMELAMRLSREQSSHELPVGADCLHVYVLIVFVAC